MPSQALGATPINMHYSMGFVSLLWQVLIILCIFSGIIMTPTVVAMDAVGWCWKRAII